MSEYHAQILFFLICAVFGVMQLVGHLQQRAAEEREKVSEKRERIDRIIESADIEQIQMEVAQLVSETIREPVKRITLTTEFKGDLRVPPGEMEVLFDEVDEGFGIELVRSEIRSFKDLLQQICEQRSS